MLRASTLAAILVFLALPRAALAFCGFYVAGSDKSLTNDATMVVLMREGQKTVLSMRNAYRGPPEDFAMVVPVPTVLQKENVKTLRWEVFDKIERLAAPRLVEYWEQDPCRSEMEKPEQWMRKKVAGIEGSGGGAHDSPLGVTVEAEFAVGEYEIVILSAENAAGLDAWLRQAGYKIPEGAEAVLRPYVEEGTKFFVAKVDPKRITFDKTGRAVLSPLRVHYDDPRFALPVRLGLINSGGVQDLIVHILSPEARFEVANYPNVTVPTNLDVEEAARGQFAAVYAKLFDATLERNPGAVVTEYAWSSASCNPCPGPALDAKDLGTLGADVIAQKTRAVPQILAQPAIVKGTYADGLPQRVLRRELGRFRACYAQGTEKSPQLAGQVTLKLTIAESGGVKNGSVKSTIADAGVTRCMNDALSKLTFPKPEHGPVNVEQTISFSMAEKPVTVPPMVLTRLHARYGKEGLGQDLVFRAATPIAGGREFLADGKKLEEGARPADTNTFQARYAIRHPWTGPITCDHPQRGIWGGPPPEMTDVHAGKTEAALDLAQAPRAGIELATFFQSDPWTGASLALEVPRLPQARSAPPANSGGGCMGCTVAEAPTGGRALSAIALVALAMVARRVGRLGGARRFPPSRIKNAPSAGPGFSV